MMVQTTSCPMMMVLITRCLYSILVDVNHAGEGNMDITIDDGVRQIPQTIKKVSRGKYDIQYSPVESGTHEAKVTFNGDHVTGK